MFLFLQLNVFSKFHKTMSSWRLPVLARCFEEALFFCLLGRNAKNVGRRFAKVIKMLPDIFFR
jgi:hypothetical protein